MAVPKKALKRAIRSIEALPARPPALLGTLIIAAVIVLAMMLGVSSLLAFQASGERRNAEAMQEHSIEVLSSTEGLRYSTVSIMRGERGYLLTGDEEFLEPYHDGKDQIAVSFLMLESSLDANSAQRRLVTQLSNSIETYLQIIDEIIALQRAGQHDAALARVRNGDGRESILLIHAQIDQFETAQYGLLAAQTQKAAKAERRSVLFEYTLGVIGLLLLVLGTFASIALRRSLAREAAAMDALQRIASTDELTGLASRREFLTTLDRMIYSAHRSGRPLAVAILDIDHFKRVNDTYGHPAGDEVIRRVAQMARQMMREHDIAGRLGGEEFALAFPDCDAATAVKACERLREGIAALPIILPCGASLRITLSSGVAQLCDADDAGDSNRDQLIARADIALYQAKQNGRDQVRLAA